MARKLKTYQTSLGFFDLAIAAPSMKAALEAWGADSNLFHQGAAKESDDPDVIAATMEKPGVVLRRAVGSQVAVRVTCERGSPFSTAGFARMVERAGEAGRAFRVTRTCCATPVALRWPTRATIRERCRLTSATATSSTRCDTPSCRRAGSRTSGADGHGRA